MPLDPLVRVFETSFSIAEERTLKFHPAGPHVAPAGNAWFALESGVNMDNRGVARNAEGESHLDAVAHMLERRLCTTARKI